jgi:hypothetical protein
MADQPEAVAFAQDLAARQGFDAAELLQLFARIHSNPKVLQLIRPPASP